MNDTHGTDGAREREVRTQPLNHRGAARGFSMVELVVSFAIFLVFSSVITLALGRSFAAASDSQSRNQMNTALADQLDKLATVPYTKLLSGDFMVPDACPDTAAGIAGDSCVRLGTQMVKIGYGFKTSPAESGCSVTDGRRYASAFGRVEVNGCVLSLGRGAFSAETAAETGLPALSRQISAPRPGFKPGAGSVRVQLSGAYNELPGSMVLLVHPARVAVAPDGTVTSMPATQVGAGLVDSVGIATIPVDNIDGTRTECNTDTPCALALNVGSTPTVATGIGRRVALVDSAAVGADAAVSVPANSVTDLSARVAPVGSASLDLLAVKADGSRVPNPTAGSVCLWATFPDAKATRSVPFCNTDDPGKIVFDLFEPGWSSFGAVPASSLAATLADSSARPMYPLPTGTPIKVSVDNPDGTCRYAPGMLGSRPGDVSRAAGAAVGWAPLAVCTSYTWGLPTNLTLDGTGSPQPITAAGTVLSLTAGQDLTGAVIWNNPTLAPGAVGYGADRPWEKARTALGCASDESCTNSTGKLVSAVADPATGTVTPTYPNPTCAASGACRDALEQLAPEAVECPGSYCYSTINAKPYLTVPASGTLKLSDTGTTTSTLEVRDADDDVSTVAAAVLDASVPNGLSVTLGAPVTVDSHTRRYPLTVKDSTGNTDVKTVHFALSGGTGSSSVVVDTEVGLYYSSGVWRLTGSPVTAAQGSTNVPVRVRVTGTDGSPYAGASVQFTANNAGLVVADATTDSTGSASGVLSVPSSVPAGTYTLTASVAGSGRSVPIRLTVTPAGSSVELSLSTTQLAQGTKGRITARALDTAAGPMPGQTVTLVVTDGTGAPSSSVYPATSGCVTGADGTCTVPLVAEKEARAGTYTLGGASNGLTATAQAFTVTPVIAAVTSGSNLAIAQGQTLPGVAFTVNDAAGDPVPFADVTLAAPSPLTISPASGATGEDGTVTVALVAPANASVGKKTITITVAGATFTVPITVTPSYGGITAQPVSIGQGTNGTLPVTLVSGTGSPVPGKLVEFFSDTPGITLTPYATSGGDGIARATVQVERYVRAGVYPVTVTVGGDDSVVNLTVTPVPATITASGALTQGASSTLALNVWDKAGDPMTNVAVAIDAKPAKMTLQANPVVTDASGAATFTVTDGGSVAGPYTLTATAAGLTVQVPVVVVASPSRIDLGATSAALTAGTSSSLTATVTDRAGKPYTQARLSIQGMPEGADATVDGLTGSDGRTTVKLRASADVTGGTYPLTLTVDDLQTAFPVTVTSSTSAALLRAGATLLLPLDDAASPGVAADAVGRHAGTYRPGGSFSFALRESSPLRGSASASFQPVDTSGALNATQKAEVSVADASADAIPATGSFTLSTWVNPRSLAGTRSALAVLKGAPTSGKAGLSVGAGNSATTLRIALSDGTSRIDQSVTLDAGSRPGDWVGKWTLVSLAFDRDSKQLRLYVNGKRQSATVSLSTLSGSLASTDPLVLGANGGYLFDGWMDEFAVLPYALTDASATGLGLSAAASSTYMQSSLAAGPAGFWRLGESSGTTLKAAAGADGSATSPTLGRPGAVDDDTSADFTRPGAFATLPTGAAGGADSFTASAWFYPTATSRTVADGVLTSGTGGSFANPRLTWGTATATGSQQLQVLWNYTAAAGGGGNALNTPNVSLHQWHHVAFTVEKASTTPTVTLYLDGNKVSSSGVMGKPINTLGPLLALGARDDTRGLPGRVDEVQVFDRALPATSIAAQSAARGDRASSTATPSYDELAMAPAPLGYWRLGEGSGALSDSSGLGGAMTSPTTGMRRGVPGLIGDRTDAALGRDGAATSVWASAGSRFAVNQWSDVVWFTTTDFTKNQSLMLNYTSTVDAAGTHYWGRVLYIDPSTGKMRAYIGQGTATTAWTYVLSPGPVPTGKANMAVITHDGATSKMYLNGALVASTPVPAYAPAPTSPYYIATSSYPLAGVQDEASTYARALTAAEVAAMWQAGQ